MVPAVSTFLCLVSGCRVSDGGWRRVSLRELGGASLGASLALGQPYLLVGVHTAPPRQISSWVLILKFRDFRKAVHRGWAAASVSTSSNPSSSYLRLVIAVRTTRRAVLAAVRRVCRTSAESARKAP